MWPGEIDKTTRSLVPRRGKKTERARLRAPRGAKEGTPYRFHHGAPPHAAILPSGQLGRRLYVPQDALVLLKSRLAHLQLAGPRVPRRRRAPAAVRRPAPSTSNATAKQGPPTLGTSRPDRRTRSRQRISRLTRTSPDTKRRNTRATRRSSPSGPSSTTSRAPSSKQTTFTCTSRLISRGTTFSKKQPRGRGSDPSPPQLREPPHWSPGDVAGPASTMSTSHPRRRMWHMAGHGPSRRSVGELAAILKLKTCRSRDI